MKKASKLLAIAIMLVMVLSLVAGCGGNTSEESIGEQAETQVLNVSMALGESEWEVMRSYVFPKFEAENNVKIQAIQTEPADLITRLEAMHQAGKMEIDIITQDNMQLAQLVEKGLVEDLSEFKSKIPGSILPSLVPVGEFNGKLFFMPYRPNVEINFYNENKFNEYDLKPPSNWDELMNVAKTFYEEEGIGRVAIKGTLDGCTTVQLFEFIRQAGGDPLVLNDDGSIKAYTFLQEIWPYLSADAARANWNTMNRYLATESVYIGANWPFGVNVIVEEGGKKEIKAYGGFSGPVKESKVLGGEVIGIPVGSPNKDLAVKFMEYLMSKETQEILVTKLGWPASRGDAYGEVEDWQKPYFAAVNDALSVAEARPNVVYWDTVDKALNDALREIAMEGKDVKATLDKYAKVIQEAKK
ncbi:sugar ABC transporter substrate-binding protein [Alkaliphilus peptidifermentans]|uniref:Carbohydrate ABC transporter substrate-binding protein, CUT1 family n=1 Tax=Alkaliphilus peptidifermentans DSM 18978 TaxID=1120976 RepID=A0A1G5JNZ6_9FIRM|nr:extracellular solute-binding protein [Alkaliphilus peptidifermentans]SCY89621.1 carbohydrate ABC transporter substrate-binding protein, CUT1 family [Alkaliphilus peptidifermentans DSM 18978]